MATTETWKSRSVAAASTSTFEGQAGKESLPQESQCPILAFGAPSGLAASRLAVGMLFSG